MTQSRIFYSLQLAGLGPYPNSVGWGTTVKFTFLEDVPGYFPDNYFTGFVGYDEAGNPRLLHEPHYGDSALND